jgi:riboflavin synthase alpha subunit
MTNDQMKAGRFVRWHVARRKVAFIQGHLAAGRTVYICTMTKATKLSAKHAGMVKATKSGAYMQAGKSWVCIDGCALKAA